MKVSNPYYYRIIKEGGFNKTVCVVKCSSDSMTIDFYLVVVVRDLNCLVALPKNCVKYFSQFPKDAIDFAVSYNCEKENV